MCYHTSYVPEKDKYASPTPREHALCGIFTRGRRTVRTDDPLRAGVAIYNAGAYQTAHGAWESKWLSPERDTDGGRSFHGLVQFTVAVHHARDGNDPGAVGLAQSARGYPDDLADDYCGVDFVDVRESPACLEANPGVVADPPALRFDDRVVTYNDLDFDAVAIATEVPAEKLDGYDESVVADAVGYAYGEVADGEQTQFTAMAFDFVWNGAQRGLVLQRLSEHVRRRRRREDDMSGLFD